MIKIERNNWVDQLAFWSSQTFYNPSWFTTLASSLLNLTVLRCPLYRDPLEFQLMWNNKYYSHSFPPNVQLASSFLHDQSWCWEHVVFLVSGSRCLTSIRYHVEENFGNLHYPFVDDPRNHTRYIYEAKQAEDLNFRPSSLLTWAIFKFSDYVRKFINCCSTNWPFNHLISWPCYRLRCTSFIVNSSFN